MSGPEMLEGIGAIRFLKMRDPKAPEDVEPTLDLLKFSQDGMETVLEGGRLEKLSAGRGLEQHPRGARADKVLKHRRKRRAEIDFAGAVLSLQVSLDEAAFGLLLNVESAAVRGDMLADFESERLAGAERPTTGEKRVEHLILSLRTFEDGRNTVRRY